MNTKTSNKLKIISNLPPGHPVSAEQLREFDISNDLLVYYVKAGWLDRLANGVYIKPNTDLDFNASLLLLQKQISGLHIGGKSALDLYGIRHYVGHSKATHLLAWDVANLPEWLTNKFECKIKRKRLFDEDPHAPMYVSAFKDKDNLPLTSEPERAALELLSEIPGSQSIKEAEEILEGAFNLRADVMSVLLHKCKSVKTVRLFLLLASKLSLPIYGDIRNEKFPTGKSNWVGSSEGRLMVLKP